MSLWHRITRTGTECQKNGHSWIGEATWSDGQWMRCDVCDKITDEALVRRLTERAHRELMLSADTEVERLSAERDNAYRVMAGLLHQSQNPTLDKYAMVITTLLELESYESLRLTVQGMMLQLEEEKGNV